MGETAFGTERRGIGRMQRMEAACCAGGREARSASRGPALSVLHLHSWTSWLISFRGFPARSHEVNVKGNAGISWQNILLWPESKTCAFTFCDF